MSMGFRSSLSMEANAPFIASLSMAGNIPGMPPTGWQFSEAKPGSTSTDVSSSFLKAFEDTSEGSSKKQQAKAKARKATGKSG